MFAKWPSWQTYLFCGFDSFYDILTNCVSSSETFFFCLPPSLPFLSIRSRHQQYECKWYIPLADLTFQTLDDSDSCPSIQVLPEHEIEEMKIKISVLKSEIQKEKVTLLAFTGVWQQIQCIPMA